MRLSLKSKRMAAKLSHVLTGLMIIAALIAVAHFLPREPEADVTGHARVIDGDSLHVGTYEIRLVGLDAPELGQDCRVNGKPWHCGREARDVLRRMTRGRQVSCRISGYDRYGRALARCRTGKTDINETLVREGWAVAYGNYETAEARAARERAGIWRGEFDLPRDHRAGRGIYGWITGFDWPWPWK